MTHFVSLDGFEEICVPSWQSVASQLIDCQYVCVLADSQTVVDAEYSVHHEGYSFSLDAIVQAIVSAAARVRSSQGAPALHRVFGVYFAERASLFYQKADKLCAVASKWLQCKRKLAELPYLISGYPLDLLEKASLDFRSYRLADFKYEIMKGKEHASLCDSLCTGGEEHCVQKGAILVNNEERKIRDSMRLHSG